MAEITEGEKGQREQQVGPRGSGRGSKQHNEPHTRDKPEHHHGVRESSNQPGETRCRIRETPSPFQEHCRVSAEVHSPVPVFPVKKDSPSINKKKTQNIILKSHYFPDLLI